MKIEYQKQPIASCNESKIKLVCGKDTGDTYVMVPHERDPKNYVHLYSLTRPASFVERISDIENERGYKVLPEGTKVLITI